MNRAPLRNVKYTRDILPAQFAPQDSSVHIHRFHLVERVAHEVFRLYGFNEIRTPIMELTELFARGVGEETDIVSKEMYSWQDINGDKLTLRPENTASVIRAYIQHQMATQRELAKLYYIGPMFRRERKQKGRYRQFFQIGVEVIGNSDHPAIEAEVMEMIQVLMQRLEITSTRLLVNSVGCPACRPQFNQVLREAIQPRLSEMCGDCNRRYETNILRVLDCKVDAAIVQEFPSIQSLLCAGCREHFAQFRRYLDQRQIKYEVNPLLVRGLDYYTRTAFEVLGDSLGAQDALLGGGRYDGLSETLGGAAAKGFGFALGLDRFVMSLPATVADPSVPQVFLVHLGEAAFDFALELASRCRQAGIACAMDFQKRNLKSALKQANLLQARYALLIGDNELNSGQFILRDLTTGAQQEITIAALLQRGPAGL
jgi:histidyl-tRNA synthetase